MAKKVSATEAKAKLLSLLDDVEKGEEIEITRRGVTIARVSPVRKPHRLLGLHEGKIFTSPRDEDLFSTGEKWNAM